MPAGNGAKGAGSNRGRRAEEIVTFELVPDGNPSDAVRVRLLRRGAEDRDLESRCGLDCLAAGNREGASLVGTGHASRALRRIEASALSCAHRLVSKVSVANASIANRNEQFAGNAERMELVMRKKGLIEHGDFPFAPAKENPRATKLSQPTQCGTAQWDCKL